MASNEQMLPMLDRSSAAQNAMHGGIAATSDPPMRDDHTGHPHHQGARTDMVNNLMRQMCIVGLTSSAIFLTSILASEATVLALEWHNACDRPLKFWLLVSAVLQIVSFPFEVEVRRRAIYGIPPNQDRGYGIKLIKSLTGLTKFVWFLVGNTWVFQSVTCATDSPHVYRLSMALVLIQYAVLCAPIILMICLLCCLPVILRYIAPVMERLQTAHRRASQQMIDSCPTRVWSDTDGAGPDSDDLVCSVCLGPFETGERVRTLPCNPKHLFHCDCVDQWLRINKACPLCQRDIDNPPPRV
eukprot:GILK01007142.1.p1 GENE.GILK01007142.1~~GILK01007142.1.p1  ORF type:complete len:299 (-),score=40.19 GILK01007142.1:163-1059(-)